MNKKSLVRVCMHILNFCLFLIQTDPGKYCNIHFCFLSCDMSLPLPLTVYFFLPSSPSSLPFSSPPPLESGTLAGSHRLQQIMNPADPLEIQADVHWTHIHEKEEEERMVPTSESSTSRGNCFKTRGPNAPRSTFCPCSRSRCCRGLFC